MTATTSTKNSTKDAVGQDEMIAQLQAAETRARQASPKIMGAMHIAPQSPSVSAGDEDGTPPVESSSPEGETAPPDSAVDATPPDAAPASPSPKPAKRPADGSRGQRVKSLPGNSDATALMRGLTRKASVGQQKERLEILGSAEISQRLDQLINDVFQAHGTRLIQSHVTEYAIQRWLDTKPKSLDAIDDQSGRVALSTRVPQSLKQDFIKTIYRIDMKVPYNRVALHAISEAIDELRAILLTAD